MEAITCVASFVEGFSYERFFADAKTRSAVVQQLIVIGESSSRMPESLRKRHPEVDWRSLTDFRNRAVHEYFSMDWDMVWNTATINTPDLEQKIRDVLRQGDLETEDQHRSIE